jgi:hypothetical protein
MKRVLRSRILLAGLFGLIGAVAALAATGNLPGLSEDPEEPRRTTTSRTTDASRRGTAFTTHPEPTPTPAAGVTRRGRPYSYEDDYRDQVYEQYFGHEEEDDVEFVRPEGGGGPGEPGEPGEPGVPGDGGDGGGGAGGQGGPGS